MHEPSSSFGNLRGSMDRILCRRVDSNHHFLAPKTSASALGYDGDSGRHRSRTCLKPVCKTGAQPLGEPPEWVLYTKHPAPPRGLEPRFPPSEGGVLSSLDDGGKFGRLRDVMNDPFFQWLSILLILVLTLIISLVAVIGGISLHHKWKKRKR